MRMNGLKKIIVSLALGGFLMTDVNCLPSRNQINSSLNGGLMSGIELALTLGVTNLLAGLIPAAADTTTTTTQ